MAEPVWVRDEVVLAIHRRQIAEHGGASGIRDQGMLASALARPRNLLACSGAAADLAAFAAAYAHGIVRNHPFRDGNKRTAFVVCRTFLLLNDSDFSASRQEKYQTFLRLAEGTLSESQLGAWIRAGIGPAGR